MSSDIERRTAIIMALCCGRTPKEDFWKSQNGLLSVPEGLLSVPEIDRVRPCEVLQRVCRDWERVWIPREKKSRAVDGSGGCREVAAIPTGRRSCPIWSWFEVTRICTTGRRSSGPQTVQAWIPATTISGAYLRERKDTSTQICFTYD